MCFICLELFVCVHGQERIFHESLYFMKLEDLYIWDLLPISDTKNCGITVGKSTNTSKRVFHASKFTKNMTKIWHLFWANHSIFYRNIFTWKRISKITRKLVNNNWKIQSTFWTRLRMLKTSDYTMTFSDWGKYSLNR